MPEPVVVTPEPQSTVVPNPVAAPVASEQKFPELSSLVPNDFKEKPWVKETKDVPSLFKRMDDLLTEIGKRPAAIPQENASDEEWSKFYKAMGLPEKPEDYDLGTPPENLPVNEEYQKGIRAVLQKAGVSKRQAKIIASGHNELISNLVKAAGQNDAKLNENFDQLKGEIFGDKADRAMEVSRVLINKYVPEKMKEHVAKLPNETLMVLASALYGIQKDYIAEDQIPSGGGGTGTGMSPDAKRQEGLRLMATEAYTNPFHPEHTATVEKVRMLYGTK